MSKKTSKDKMEQVKPSSIDQELQSVLDNDSCLVLEAQTVNPSDSFLPFGETIVTDTPGISEENYFTDDGEYMPDDIESDDWVGCAPLEFDEETAQLNVALVPDILKTIQVLATQLKYCSTNEQKETLLGNITHLTLSLHY